MRTVPFLLCFIIISCFFVNAFLPVREAYAGSKVRVSGTGCQELGDRYSIPQAKNIAEKKAIRNALRGITVFSKSDFIDVMGMDSESEYQFVISLIESIVVGRIEKPKFSKFYEKRKNVFCREVTGWVDQDEIEQLVEQFVGIDSTFDREFEKKLTEYEQVANAAKNQDRRIDQLEKDVAETERDINYAKSPGGPWGIAKTRLEDAKNSYDRIKRIYDEDPTVVDLNMLEKRLVDLKRMEERFADEQVILQMLKAKRSKLTSRLESEIVRKERLKTSLKVMKNRILGFVVTYPIVQIAPGESDSGKTKSVYEKNREAEMRALKLSRKIAAHRMYSRINTLPSAVREEMKLDGPESLAERLKLKEKIFLDDHGQPSAEPVWQADQGYGKALAIIKATYGWKGDIPRVRYTEELEPKKKEAPKREVLRKEKKAPKKKEVPWKKSWVGGISIGVEQYCMDSFDTDYWSGEEEASTITGDIYVVGFEFMSSDPGWSAGIDLKLFGGEPATGHLVELTPRFRTQLEWLFDGYLDYDIGIGWTGWRNRHVIEGTVYDKYNVYYLKLGFELNPGGARKRLRVAAGLKLPISAEVEQYWGPASTTDKYSLEGDYSFYGSIACRLSDSWAISLLYDSYHFKETDRFPRRERSTNGLNLVYLF